MNLKALTEQRAEKQTEMETLLNDVNAEERATWELMAKRNAVNYGYEDAELVVLKGLEELEGMAL